MNATESKNQPSWKQMLALATFIAGVLGEIFSNKQMQQHLQNKSNLRKKILEVFEITADAYVEIRKEWTKFYKSEFKWTMHFDDVRIPEKPEGNYRLLFIARGMTPNKVFDAWKFPKSKAVFKDLDKEVLMNKRTNNKSYAVWILADNKPDQEFLNKSTSEVDPNMELGMTLLECMVFESKYFSETGKHLKGANFCSGSRLSKHLVATVDECNGRICVSYGGAGFSNTMDGIRRVFA